MIVLGRLCSQKMWVMNRLASSSALIIVEHGTKCIIFVNLSTTTQIASWPFELGKPVTQSIVISFQGYSGAGSGCRTP
jgi:hypothetical protein